MERSAYDYGSTNMVCVFQSLVYLTFAALGGDHLAHMALVCTVVYLHFLAFTLNAALQCRL